MSSFIVTVIVSALLCYLSVGVAAPGSVADMKAVVCGQSFCGGPVNITTNKELYFAQTTVACSGNALQYADVMVDVTGLSFQCVSALETCYAGPLVSFTPANQFSITYSGPDFTTPLFFIISNTSNVRSRGMVQTTKCDGSVPSGAPMETMNFFVLGITTVLFLVGM
eukprot:ANDGO_01344.mRNA.1 hypothetical protein